MTVAGSIPPELGNLSVLQRLNLDGRMPGGGKLTGEAGDRTVYPPISAERVRNRIRRCIHVIHP